MPCFHCGPFKKNQRLGGGKKFIRSDSKGRVFGKIDMIDDNNKDIDSS